jgi:hypothetical protein
MLRLVLDSFRSTVPDVTPDATTVLFGRGAAIDSVALVTVLVEVEKGLAGIDLSTHFMEHADDPEDRHPFRSVASLAGFLASLDGGAR